MMSKLPWRPIADLPSHVTRALVFDPDSHWRERHRGEIVDERVNVATLSRHNGLWYVGHHQGDFDVTPTHFVELDDVPDGYPLVLTASKPFP